MLPSRASGLLTELTLTETLARTATARELPLLRIEWEDVGMDREHGAKEACSYLRSIDFAPSSVAFDAAFAR